MQNLQNQEKNRMAQRKYSTYKTLESALRRDKFEKTGILATALLNMFIFEDSELRASSFVEKGLCAVGKFSTLRRTLVDKGWLVWSEMQINKAKYYPGRNLIRFIKRERMNSAELVTTDQIIPKEALQAELNSTKIRLNSMEKRLDNVEKLTAQLVEVVGPPNTPLRIKKRISLAEQLAKATTPN